jgi:hypothetical protein
MRFSAVIGLLTWFALSSAALAHRMNSAMSLIEINPSSGKIEVTHTLFAHDLEGVLGAGSVSMNWFETAQGEAAIRTYCERKFVLNSQNGRPISLIFVGVELSGGQVNVYFEGRQPRGRTFTVDADFLQEVSDSQVNRVNLRAHGQTVSAVFRAGEAAKSLAIPQG